MSQQPGYMVRTYRPGDEVGILALFNRVFGEGDPGFTPRGPEFWDWEYRQPPHGPWAAVAVSEAGDVIAHYATIPLRARLDGDEVLVTHGVDSMVHPDWRRRLKREGPFLQAAQLFFATWGNAQHAHAGYGFPNKIALRVGTSLLGYHIVHQPLPTRFLNFFQGAPDVPQVPGITAGPLHELGADVDALWQRVAPSVRFGLVRDRAYLAWRYLRCPIPHDLLALRDAHGGLRGILALRAGWAGVPILAVCEIVAPPEDRDAFQAALAAACAQARARGMGRLELWVPPHSTLAAHADALGLGTEPSFYNPCLMLYREPPERIAWYREHWYFTIGDSDLF